jgi:hypothetical protein
MQRQPGGALHPNQSEIRMALNIHAVADAAVQITRAAPLFDRLADHLVAQLQDSCEPEDAAQQLAQRSDLRGLRERLDAFFPEFRRLYGSLLIKHLGPERAPQVIAALSDDSVQLYFRALQAMEGELQGALERLGERMVFAARAEARG